MSKKTGLYNVTTNGHVRELISIAEMPESVMHNEFDYVGFNPAFDEYYMPRFFKYRNSYYDSHEFERSPDAIKALGYDGFQSSSYFDGIALAYFDKDGYDLDGVIVAHIHW